MVTPIQSPESRPRQRRVPLAVCLAGSIALSVLLACANGSDPTASEEPPGIESVLTRRIAETFLAYQDGRCDDVLGRTADIQLDPRGSEAHVGELLVRAFCLERSGDVAAATELYEQLSLEAPLSFAALDARERLRVLDLLASDSDYAAWVSAAPDRAASIRKGRPPIDRVKAAFPPVPYALGLEGYAVVEFGVLPDGQTDAAIIVDAQPPLLFEGTALRAVREWRYARAPSAAETQRQVVRILFRSPRNLVPLDETTSDSESAAN